MHFAYSDLGTWYSCQFLLFLGISKSSSVLKYISKFCCGQVLRGIKLEGLFGNTTLLRNEESYCCLNFFLFYVHGCFACMLVKNTMNMLSACRGQKRASNSLEMKLQMVVSHRVGPGN